jgi:hypothetical protein
MSDALQTAEDAVETTLDDLTIENEPELAPESNPFALTEDHEFKAPPEVDRVDVYRTTGGGEPTLIASVPPNGNPIVDLIPALPGSPESDYRRCPCIGVMPGRACPRCNCSKWVKTCPKCNGEQFLKVQSRKGAHARTERCGFCMGLGQVAARLDEVTKAQEAAKAATGLSAPAETALRREVRLPNPANGKLKTFAERAKAKASKGPKRRAARG